MALLEIKKFGCPVLRQKATPIRDITDEMQQLIEDMFATMYAAEGVGLAAQQVGFTERLLVLDVRPRDALSEPLVFINPEILWTEGEHIGEEGCLSLPGIAGDVRRPARIGVRARDGNGREFEMDLDGIAAKVLQHEIDHLDGVLIVEHFNAIKRNLVRGQLRKLQREGKRQALGLTYR